MEKLWSKKTLIALGLGQFLSLLNTSTGFSSSELARKGIHAPTSQSLANYALLAIVYGSILIYRREKLKVDFLIKFVGDDTKGLGYDLNKAGFTQTEHIA